MSVRSNHASLSAIILAAALAAGACTASGGDELRDRLDQPTDFRLLPYVSMAELGLRIDGEASARALVLDRGAVTLRTDAAGNLGIDKFELQFAPIAVDDERSIDRVRVRVAPGTSFLSTEWSIDDDACFAHAAAILEVGDASAELDLMVSSSMHEGAPVLDLMVGESPDLALWPDVTLASITLVLHGVAAE